MIYRLGKKKKLQSHHSVERSKIIRSLGYIATTNSNIIKVLRRTRSS